MNLDSASKENLAYIINDMAERLNVVNRSIMDPDDYDLNKYEDLRDLHAMLEQKGSLSPNETQAFLDELASYRK